MKVLENYLQNPYFLKNQIIGKRLPIEADRIIADDTEIAELMNNFFSKTVEKLNIRGYENAIEVDSSLNTIDHAIAKFVHHPSIIKIRENVINQTFSFNTSSEYEICNKIINMKANKLSF